MVYEMKIRTGFVSNSSSSSFVVRKEHLKPDDIIAIYEHEKVAEKDAWSITETSDEIHGFTVIDNFSIIQYLREKGVNLKYFHFDNF